MSSEFTDSEQAALAPYFTNVDLPVFARINLPETVKGALFARYSRSAKSLRRHARRAPWPTISSSLDKSRSVPLSFSLCPVLVLTENDNVDRQAA